MSRGPGRAACFVFGTVLFLFCFPNRAHARQSESGKEAVRDLDEGLDKLRKERDKLMDEISYLKTEKSALAEEMRLRVEEAESRAGDLNKELDEAYVKIEKLEFERADLADKLKDARLELEKFDGAFNVKDTVFMQVKDENDRLKTDLANAQTVLQRSAEKIRKLNKEKENAENEAEATKKRLRSYFSDQDTQLSEIRGQREELRKQITILSARLEVAEDRRQTAFPEAQAVPEKPARQAEGASEGEAKLKKNMSGTSHRKVKDTKETAAALAQAEKRLEDAGKKISDLEKKNRVAQAMMELANEKLQYYAKALEDSKKKQAPSPFSLEACRQENETLKARLTSLSEHYKRALDEIASFKKAGREEQRAAEAPKAK